MFFCLGKHMFDYTDEFKTSYRSKSRESIYVPLIANPPPKESDIT